MQNEDWLPTTKNIEDFELLNGMLDAISDEFDGLSRKKQDGVLNLTKVKMVNRILKPLKEEILLNEPSNIFLDLLDEQEIPNNSDVVLIISQYKRAIKEFKDKYYTSKRDDGSYWKSWDVSDPEEDDEEEEEEEDEEDEEEEEGGE